MTNLVKIGELTRIDENPVLDTRVMAEKLNVQHKNLLGTIYKYQETIESTFGPLTFETEVKKGNRGGELPKFALLTEEQANFIAALSKNTPVVVEFKAWLVKSFSEAKRLLANITPIDRLDSNTRSVLSLLASDVQRELHEVRQEIKNEVSELRDELHEEIKKLQSAPTHRLSVEHEQWRPGDFTINSFAKSNDIYISRRDSDQIMYWANEYAKLHNVKPKLIKNTWNMLVKHYPADILELAFKRHFNNTLFDAA